MLLAELSDAEREDLEERAAIREFLGGQSRADAERDALSDVERTRARARERKGPLRADGGGSAGAQRHAK